jgi:aminomethyltransferase
VQVGRTTSTTWSPTLKKLVALAIVQSDCAAVGSEVQVELTVNHERKQARARIAKLPFFNPPRKTA